MKKCILHKWLQHQFGQITVITIRLNLIFHTNLISVPRMINQNIIFNVDQLLFHRNHFLRVADRIAQQADKCINRARCFFGIILIHKPLNACKCIVNIMGIDLHLQCLNLRLALRPLGIKQFPDIILNVIEHFIVGTGELLHFTGSFYRNILTELFSPADCHFADQI